MESGGGRQAPSTQPSVLASLPSSDALELSSCARHDFPLSGVGSRTLSVATPALSLQKSDVPGLAQAGHSRGSLCLGAGAVLPRRTLRGQDKRIFSAENSPSVSFPCPALPGASGAAARPLAHSISYPLNPCGAGLESQESRFIPMGKLTNLSTGEGEAALVIADGSAGAGMGS